MSDAKRTCQECGIEIPANAPEKLCPACLLQEGHKTAGPRTPLPPADADATGGHLPDAEAVASLFPQLEIGERLGRGAMGSVFKARQPGLDRFVALKLLSTPENPELVERFRREAQALARLTHPGIVQIYDSGVIDGHLYFLMEYVDGQSIHQILREDSMAPDEVIAVMTQICDAMQYAHDQGIAHRDLKPANILINAEGQVKIADFGLAKILHVSPKTPDLTMSRQSLGTPFYMAPEQRKQGCETDARADIYAMGVLFYEMLTRELPTGRVALPSQLTCVDPRLDDVVMKAMELAPENRFQTAREMARTIARDESHAPQAAPEPQPAQRSPATPARQATPPATPTGGGNLGAVFKRWWWTPAVTIPLTVVAGILVTLLVLQSQPRLYQGRTVIQFTRPSMTGGSSAPEATATQIAVIKSNAIVDSVVAQLDLGKVWELTPSEARERILRHLGTSRMRSTDLVKVTYLDPDPGQAALIANAITEAYLDSIREQLARKHEKTIAALELEMDERKKRVEDARQKMLDLAEQYDIDDLLAEPGGIKPIAEKELKRLEEDLRILQGFKNDILIAKAAQKFPDEPEIRQHFPEYQELALTKSQLIESGLGRRHPRVVAVTTSLNETRILLLQGVNRIIASIETRLELARQSITIAPGDPESGNLGLDTPNIAEYLETRQAYIRQRQSLSTFLEKLTAENIETSMPTAGALIHERAEVPMRPATANRSMKFLLGAALSLFVGVLLAIPWMFACQALAKRRARQRSL